MLFSNITVERKVKTNLRISAHDVMQALKDYRHHMGIFRYAIEQSDIAKLKALSEKLGPTEYLNEEQAFVVVDILLNREAKQNCASDDALQNLEQLYEGMILVSRVLNELKLFIPFLFFIIYDRLNHCKAIRENLTLLHKKNILISREIAETICRFSIEKEYSLPDIIEKCSALNIPESLIHEILKTVLSNEISGMQFCKKIQEMNFDFDVINSFYEFKKSANILTSARRMANSTTKEQESDEILIPADEIFKKAGM